MTGICFVALTSVQKSARCSREQGKSRISVVSLDVVGGRASGRPKATRSHSDHYNSPLGP